LVETALAISRKNHSLPLETKTSLTPSLSEVVPKITIDIDDVVEAAAYFIKREVRGTFHNHSREGWQSHFRISVSRRYLGIPPTERRAMSRSRMH
jgi:enoyl-[acyl-carrier-protein] reductase (NADH)